MMRPTARCQLTSLLSLLGLGLAVALVLQPAHAGLPELIPRKVLFGNPERTQPRLSPDGKMLAYLAPDEGVLNVWVRTVGKEDDRAITEDRKRGVRFFVWQYDSEHILYIQDIGGDENWHLYQTSIKSERTRDLTPFLGARAQGVFADPNYPTEVLVGLNLRERKLHDIYRINLDNGAVELDTKNPGDVASWNTDVEFQIRAAHIQTPDGGTEIRVRDDSKSPWRLFQKWGPDETFGGVLGFTPDNQAVYMVSSVDANTSRLLEINLADKQSKLLAEDRQYDVSGILAHPKTHKFEAVRFTRARSEWQAVDPAVKEDLETLKKMRDGDFSVGSRDLADQTWLVSYVEDDGPVYYYAYDRKTKQATVLFSNRPGLEKHQLSKMKPVSFDSRDGLKLHGYLTLPHGVEPKHLPAMLLVHGGPWGRDVWGLNANAQWLANRGYAVLQVNFRGSTGYGKDFLNAGDKEWGAKMQHDLIDGKKWLIEQGFVDPQRIGIMGGSYGGYATLAALAFTPEEFACGVDIVGPSNIVTLLQTIPPYWEPIKATFKKRVGDLETEEDFLRSRSPLFKAHQISRPLIIAQGANDPRVKQAESDQIVKAMRENDKPVEYIVFPDEGHGFARPENRLKFYAAAEAFLGKHLGGRAESASEEESVKELMK